MKIVGVIPARYESTRLKAKVLADINGKPMIQHVYERAKASRQLSDLIIACDDERIFEKAKEFAAKVVLTSKLHSSGSDRIAEVIKNLDVDIVVNIQGDEPLIQASIIDSLVKALKNDPQCVMSTPIRILKDERNLTDPNVVKVVIDKNKYALFFSRSIIPFNRDQKKFTEILYYQHLGLYAYRKDFLLSFVNLPKSYLEKTEQLEQLRVLEAGYKIKTVLTDIETMSIDTQEDLDRLKKLLKGNLKHG